MQYRIWSMLFFIWANVAGHAVFAQDVYANPQQEKYLSDPIQPRNFDESVWEKSIEGLDYSTPEKKPTKIKPSQKPGKFEWPKLSAGVVIFLKVLVIAILLIILVLLLQHYLNSPKNRAVKKAHLEELSIEEIEENLEETELPPYIRKAIENDDFGLAIRLYYLEVLKQLSQQKIISWRKNKTNRQYLQEMRNFGNYREFRMLTMIFERVRYGGQVLTRPEFEQIEPGFLSFLETPPSAIASPPAVNVAAV